MGAVGPVGGVYRMLHLIVVAAMESLPQAFAKQAEAQRLEKLHGLTMIPPFDDPFVIAGQGTIGLELMTQTSLRKLEAVFCCVGGG